MFNIYIVYVDGVGWNLSMVHAIYVWTIWKDKVKVTVIFRGREITLTQQGRKLLEKIVQETEEIASVEQHPKFEGRTMVMVLAPKPAIIASWQPVIANNKNLFI